LNDFTCDLTALIETIKLGRFHITSDEHKAMEAASLDIAKIANKIVGEVKALRKRRKMAVITERQKLLSRTESTKLELMSSQKRNQGHNRKDQIQEGEFEGEIKVLQWHSLSYACSTTSTSLTSCLQRKHRCVLPAATTISKQWCLNL
jgi:hypothetical protein